MKPDMVFAFLAYLNFIVITDAFMIGQRKAMLAQFLVSVAEAVL